MTVSISKAIRRSVKISRTLPDTICIQYSSSVTAQRAYDELVRAQRRLKEHEERRSQAGVEAAGRVLSGHHPVEERIHLRRAAPDEASRYREGRIEPLSSQVDPLTDSVPHVQYSPCDAYYGVGDGTGAVCKRPEGHPDVSKDGIGHSPEPVEADRVVDTSETTD